jgi:hypothetical protein
MTNRQALQDFPDTGQVLVYENKKINLPKAENDVPVTLAFQFISERTVHVTYMSLAPTTMFLSTPSLTPDGVDKNETHFMPNAVLCRTVFEINVRNIFTVITRVPFG